MEEREFGLKQKFGRFQKAKKPWIETLRTVACQAEH